VVHVGLGSQGKERRDERWRHADEASALPGAMSEGDRSGKSFASRQIKATKGKSRLSEAWMTANVSSFHRFIVSLFHGPLTGPEFRRFEMGDSSKGDLSPDKSGKSRLVKDNQGSFLKFQRFTAGDRGWFSQI
jgi:hypothetical protein